MEEQKSTPNASVPNRNSKIAVYILAGLLAIVVLTIAILVGIFIGRKYFKEEGTELQNHDETSTENTDAETEPTLSISSPSEDDEVDGEIDVSGRATASLGQLTLRIYDNAHVVLGEEPVTLEAEEGNTLVDWNATLNVNISPSATGGFIIVFPSYEGESSALAVILPVNFAAAETEDHVVLFSPLEHQTFNGGELFVNGQMKNFFEGVMNIRLKSNDGTVLFEDVIHANGDNYVDYVYFEKTVEVGDIPEGIDENGVFQVYDVSMGDGSVNILLSIPMKLK